MELHEALAQITQIREHLARGEVFRGYRSLTVGYSSALAVVGALFQSVWLPRPLEQLDAYLALWIVVAIFSAIVAGVEIGWRYRRTESESTRRLTQVAVSQFVPCLIAGVVVTAAIAQRAVDAAWMLPGLWSLLFSLGVFASFRWLPRSIFWVGVYYLVAGTLCLAAGPGDAALSPVAMGATFGGGQLLAAVILYSTLERPGRAQEI